MKSDDIIRKYLDSVSSLDIITALGARNIKDKNAKWIIHSCLIDDYEPHHSNRDENPSAAIDTDTKRYSCFAYGVVSIYRLLDIVFSKDSEKIAFLRELPFHENKTSFRDKLKMSMEQDDEPVRFKKVSDLFFESMDKDYSYMESRGISEEVCKKHGIVFDSSKEAVLIPVFRKGSAVAYQRRNLKGGMPKYENSEGFPKENLLYYGSGAEQSKSIILVESVMSVLKLETLGFPTAVCTFGSKVFDAQAAMLAKHRDITVWFDDDYSGVSGALSFVEKYHKMSSISVVISDVGGKDPGDMTKEEVVRNLEGKMSLLEAVPFLRKAKALLSNKGLQR